MIARCVKGSHIVFIIMGELEDLEELNSHNMYEYYQELLTTRPLDLFFVGNIGADELAGLIQKYFPHDGESRSSVELGSVIHPVRK